MRCSTYRTVVFAPGQWDPYPSIPQLTYDALVPKNHDAVGSAEINPEAASQQLFRVFGAVQHRLDDNMIDPLCVDRAGERAIAHAFPQSSSAEVILAAVRHYPTW